MAYYPPGYTPGVPGAYPAAGAYPPGVGYPGAAVPGAYPPGVGAYPAAVAVAHAERRCFHIIAEWNGEVLDISHDDARPGAPVITWQRKMARCPNQLWFCDQTGVIRSALNDFALEARALESFRMMPYTGQPDQQWIFAGNRIVNRVRPTECLTDREGERPCHAKGYKGKPRQHWRVEMVM